MSLVHKSSEWGGRKFFFSARCHPVFSDGRWPMVACGTCLAPMIIVSVVTLPPDTTRIVSEYLEYMAANVNSSPNSHALMLSK